MDNHLSLKNMQAHVCWLYIQQTCNGGTRRRARATPRASADEDVREADLRSMLDLGLHAPSVQIPLR